MKIHCLSVCFIESVCIFSKFKIDNAGGFFIHWFNYFLVMLNMRNIRDFWLRIMTDKHENSFGLHLSTRKLIRKSIKVSLVIKLEIPLAQ